MPAFSAVAPGKIILFGEHAVVYSRPAIAVPVFGVQARVVVSANPRGSPGDVRIEAPAIGLDAALAEIPAEHPLAVAIQLAAQKLGVTRIPACRLRITSTIPVAAGMGSGAAVSVALIRALSAFLGGPLSDEHVSSLAFEVEKIYHGTPSGIDNTVITYGKPIFFLGGQPVETLTLRKALYLVIGDTGIPSPTATAVGDVRRSWEAEKSRYETLFDQIGNLTLQARQALESGQVEALGMLMNSNQELLGELGVSCGELDRLIASARQAGACGAKLSGGGRGGNMIALAPPELAVGVASALQTAGAVRILVTEVR